MNPRKRQAPDNISTRRHKQPRLALKGYDGGTPSPSEKEGLLSRWNRFRLEFYSLSVDTFTIIFSSLWFIAHHSKNSSTYHPFQKWPYENEAIRENLSPQIRRTPPLNKSLCRPSDSYLTDPQILIIPHHREPLCHHVMPPHHRESSY